MNNINNSRHPRGALEVFELFFGVGELDSDVLGGFFHDLDDVSFFPVSFVRKLSKFDGVGLLFRVVGGVEDYCRAPLVVLDFYLQKVEK